MSYCFNPLCPKPHNQAGMKFCTSCGTKLRLGDRYRAIKLLSQGSFGRTFLAADESTPASLHYIVKEFLPRIEDCNSEKLEALFVEEAARLEAIGKHPQLPELLDYLSQDERQYLVLEYIEGKNLDGELAETGRFSEDKVRQILEDLLPVLEFVHEKEIIHLDIKPENVIRRSDGQLMLVDFGTARLAATALPKMVGAIATSEYIAPEQTRGRSLFATDLYSLGAIAIHLLTQVSPFELFDVSENAWMWRDFLQGNPVNQQFGEILDKLIEPAVSKRYQSTREVLVDLDGISWEAIANTEPSFQPDNIATTSKLILPKSTALGAIVVDAAGTGDCLTINEALLKAAAGSQILVRPGTYRESLTLDKHIEIIGDGAAADIIIESTNSSCIMMATDSAVVRGLTLKGVATQAKPGFCTVDIPRGLLIVEDCDISCDSLACIGVYGVTAKPIIRRCQIRDGKEIGIFVQHQAEGTLEDCDIFGNALAGISIEKGGNPIVRRCHIRDNQEIGVFACEKGRGTLEDCDIFGNGSAGMASENGGNPIVRRCKIRKGGANGIYVWDNGEGTIEDCDIANNGNAGIAIENGGNPTVRRCQIRANKSDGVFVSDSGLGRLENCEISGNAKVGIAVTQEGDLIVQNCQINRNKYHAVYVHEKAKLTIEECDLTNNNRGAFDIGFWCTVKRRGNKI